MINYSYTRDIFNQFNFPKIFQSIRSSMIENFEVIYDNVEDPEAVEVNPETIIRLPSKSLLRWKILSSSYLIGNVFSNLVSLIWQKDPKTLKYFTAPFLFAETFFPLNDSSAKQDFELFKEKIWNREVEDSLKLLRSFFWDSMLFEKDIDSELFSNWQKLRRLAGVSDNLVWFPLVPDKEEMEIQQSTSTRKIVVNLSADSAREYHKLRSYIDSQLLSLLIEERYLRKLNLLDILKFFGVSELLEE